MLSCKCIFFLFLCLDLCFSSSELFKDENDKVVAKSLQTLKDQDIRIKELEEFNKILLDKIDQVEQQVKVNNVIFRNVEESKNENHYISLKKVLHVLNKVMKVRTKAEEISVALRVDGDNATEIRPIVVRFTNFATKMKILAARKKLKNTKVEISADYSELVNLKRKELLPFLQEKRAQGHNAFIYYDKMMVDGVRVSLEDLKAERKNEEEEKTEEEKPKVNPEEENPKVDPEEKKPKVDPEVEVSTTETTYIDEQREEDNVDQDYIEYFN